MIQKQPIYFVFYTTSLSYAIVNLKPVYEGHILVCPIRKVKRVKDLSIEETKDLFKTAQKMSVMINKIYHYEISIGIQDGKSAGQTINHVHTHIIPRKDTILIEDDKRFTRSFEEMAEESNLYKKWILENDFSK